MKMTKFRNVLAKVRFSSHDFNKEQGRYKNITRNERKCLVCNLDEIEDEYLFILVCQLYHELRKTYIKKYFYKRPCVFKLTELLKTGTSLKVLINLSLFCLKSFTLRKEKIML